MAGAVWHGGTAGTAPEEAHRLPRSVAADGDELRSAYVGTGTVDLQTGRIDFEFTGTYVGGSGRFTGASGATHIVGVVEGGVADFTEEGSIT